MNSMFNMQALFENILLPQSVESQDGLNTQTPWGYKSCKHDYLNQRSLITIW